MNKAQRHRTLNGFLLSVLALIALLISACSPQATPQSIALSALPPQPDLTSWTSELGARINQSEIAIRDGENPIAALAELSKLYHANGFYSESSRCYLGLIELEPNNPKWPYRIATLLSGFGRIEEALPHWQKSVSQAPENETALIRLGDAYLKINDLVNADEAYNRTLKENPKNPYAEVGKARIAMAGEEWNEAISHLKSADSNSNARVGTDLLISIYERIGNIQEADSIREKTTTSGLFFDISDPWIHEIFLYSYDPHRIAVAAGRAKHAEDFDLAIKLLEHGIEVSPKDGYLRLELGMIHAESNRPREAKTQFETCVEVAPYIEEGWSMLSSLYRLSGDAQQADRVLIEGIRNCPDSPGLRLGKARRLNQFGRIEEALAEYEIVFSLYLEDAEPYVEAALLYFKANRTNEGFKALESALEVQPSFLPALVEMTHHKIIAKKKDEAATWLARITKEPGINPRMIADMRRLFEKTFAPTLK